jgi:hypothetical protein
MNAPNFSSILDKPVDAEANRPKPLPVGTYTCIVDGIPRHDLSKQKQTPFVEFQLKPVSPGPDVDQEALAAAGGLKNLRTTFYTTEEAIFRLDQFLENLGIEKGMSRKEAISQAPGRQVLATVTHRASQDGTAIFAEVNSTARV